MHVNLGKNLGQQRPSSLHRVTAAWGEGASSWFGGSGAEGGLHPHSDNTRPPSPPPSLFLTSPVALFPTPATEGDATWLDRFYPDTPWTAPGGDYDAEPLAATTLRLTGQYEWGGPALAQAVAGWIADPASDHGLLLKGDESCTNPSSCAPTALRFFSREGAAAANDAALAPRLTIDFEPPEAELYNTCCLAEGGCALQESATCESNGGVAGLGRDCDAVTCSPQCTAEEIITGQCIVGACCLPAGTCTAVTSGRCEELDGAYKGDSSACDIGMCEMQLELFVDELPRPRLAQPDAGRAGAAANYTLRMVETQLKVHRDLPPTTLWTYNGMFPGPTIEAWSNEPVQVRGTKRASAS